MKHLFPTVMPLLSLAILAVTGCVKALEVPSRNQRTFNTTGIPEKVELVPYLSQIEGRNGDQLTNDTNLIWNNSGHTAIIAPDGHQLTLGEFLSVKGFAEITTSDQGTGVTLELQDLIPGGLYSLWILTFKPPGFHGNYNNLIGYGAFALTGSTKNTFTAGLTGTASISGSVYAQALSVFGSVPKCFCAEYEVQIVAAYHSNNHVYNGNPGDPDSWITQFMFPY